MNLYQRKKLINLFFLLFVLILIPITLSSCSPIKKEEIFTNLLPNVWVFISHSIACLIFFAIAFFLLCKPTKKFLHKKHEALSKKVNEINILQDEAKKKLLDLNYEKNMMIKQAKEIKLQAQNDASKIIFQAKNNAKNQAKKIIDQTNYFLLQEKIKNEKMYENNVASIAIIFAENILKKKFKKEEQQKYFNDILTQIGKDLDKNAK